jgi:hypothetical protein
MIHAHSGLSTHDPVDGMRHVNVMATTKVCLGLDYKHGDGQCLLALMPAAHAMHVLYPTCRASDWWPLGSIPTDSFPCAYHETFKSGCCLVIYSMERKATNPPREFIRDISGCLRNSMFLKRDTLSIVYILRIQFAAMYNMEFTSNCKYTHEEEKLTEQNAYKIPFLIFKLENSMYLTSMGLRN